MKYLQRLQEEVATLCARMLRTSKLGDNPPEWLKGRLDLFYYVSFFHLIISYAYHFLPYNYIILYYITVLYYTSFNPQNLRNIIKTVAKISITQIIIELVSQNNRILLFF